MAYRADSPESSGGHLLLPRPRAALPGSLGERLRAARDRAFVGRERELAAFRSLLRDGGVLHLHGPGGIGKSTLLRRFADEARDAGRTVAEVDGHSVDPTPAAFAAEVHRAGGSVLLIDAFEHCQGLEGWLREVFLPRLPAGTAVVVAGREPFAAAAHRLELTDLSTDEATRLLEIRGVPAESRTAVLSFTGGHPLALSLAATLPTGALPPAGRRWRPTPEVLASLLGTLIGEVPSGAHRRALEICAHAPHTTQALLAAAGDAVPGDDGPEPDAGTGPDGAAGPGALLAWLRALPFADAGRHGVALHDMVREAIDADLRWRDPTGYARMHHAVGNHLLARVREAGTPAEALTATRALAHLQRYGPAAEWLTPLPQHGGGYEDALLPGDHAAVVEMTRAAEGDESAALVTHWLRAQPESFRVYRRSADDVPTGFLLWLRLPVGAPGTAAADPVTAAAWAHADRTRPLGAGEHIGMIRFMIDGGGYGELTPATHTLQLRVYSTWIRSDRMAWTYAPTTRPATWERFLGLVGHHPTGVSVTLGPHTHTLFARDWRTTPDDSWFALTAPAAGPPGPTPAALARPDFDNAVREALRDFHRPAALATNPLLHTRMVAASAHPPVEALRDLLTDAVDALRDDPRESRLHRVVATTFFHRLPTQVAAAERLTLSFSTYRRHLHRGIDHICTHLWHRESATG